MINDHVYTMLVIMAVVTTAMAGPMLNVVYPKRWLDRDIAEAERKRTNAAKDRVAVVIDDPNEARPGVELAAAYGGGRDTGSVTLLRLTEDTGGLEAFVDNLGELDALRATAAQIGVNVHVISRASSNPAADTVAEVERLGVAAVVLPPKLLSMAPAVRRAGADVIVAGATPIGAAGVQVRGGSDADDQAALEVGTRLALFHRVPLHVSGGVGRRARQGARSARRRRTRGRRRGRDLRRSRRRPGRGRRRGRIR